MRVRQAVALGVVVGCIGTLLRPSQLGVRLEEEAGLRWLFALRGPIQPPPDVAIVSIDRASAQQLGIDATQWPPPRSIHARVIRSLNRHRVSAIVMDVWFAAHRTPDDDDDLARAMAESRNVVLVQRVDRPRVPGVDVSTELLQSPVREFREAALGLAPFPLPRNSPTPVYWPFFETSAGIVPTLPVVALQAHGLALLPRLAEELRRVGVPIRPAVIDHPANVEQLTKTMRTLRVALEQNPGARAAARDHLASAADLSDAERQTLTALVALYGGGELYYLNFYGPPGTIQTVPFNELLNGGDEAEPDLAGKVVFIGESVSTRLTSAIQTDSHPTVYSTADGTDLSGTEIGATAFANLLTNRMLEPIAPPLAFIGLFLFGLVAGLASRLLPGIQATLVVVVLAVATAASAVFWFTKHALLVPLAVPVLVQLPIALFVGVLLRYRDVRRQTPIEVDPHGPQQLFEGVCLATDVKGYTSLAEQLTPDALHALLDEYFALLRRIVARRKGLMWGRGGDSALCVWQGARKRGAIDSLLPASWHRRADTEARVNACLAALELRDAIDRFNAGRAATSQLVTRIGLDAGSIGLGPVGGELQAVGNPPNTASRIEALNKLLSTRVLASAAVVRGVDALLVRPLGSFPLRGKTDPVQIVEIVGRRAIASDAQLHLCEQFAIALELHERREWLLAVSRFDALLVEYPSDGPTSYFRGLCMQQLLSANATPRPPVTEI